MNELFTDITWCF